ncbi:ATP-binding cassette domain-containing protein [Clostridium hydrogeniformans]|uniref:ATP-binding cassette domain-containing protein n=1 Tax=Clostridium hydrogeniformans TaxID=349933 RepID=UPI000689EC8A|nr:ATP-binding cassette domain-containing protein [Clostridium hydrogeniformans]
MIDSEYLKIQELSKTFGRFNALNNISFTVKEGEFLCLLGPSGCGKTTLLRVLAGLESCEKGRIYLKGRDITSEPTRKRGLGIVFQSYALFPNMTAFENISIGLKEKKIDKLSINNRVKEVLDLVELENCKEKYPKEMSGGQQQRVALARALALSPDFLLLDEPLSALDAKVRAKLRYEIKELQQKLGITTIMVTHDQEEALSMADRIVVMNNSKIEQIGTPLDIYKNPCNNFVADFIGVTNFIENENIFGSYGSIRPEDFLITRENIKNSRPSIIKSMEFRGGFYRIFVNLLSTNDISKEIIADIPWYDCDSLNLRDGDKIYLSIRQNKKEVYVDDKILGCV